MVAHHCFPTANEDIQQIILTWHAVTQESFEQMKPCYFFEIVDKIHQVTTSLVENEIDE